CRKNIRRVRCGRVAEPTRAGPSPGLLEAPVWLRPYFALKYRSQLLERRVGSGRGGLGRPQPGQRSTAPAHIHLLDSSANESTTWPARSSPVRTISSRPTRNPTPPR